ncbi:uncharacterized protein PgNI_09096 [Pyricularia grisea]|uniref:Mitochondrial transcription factor 1 n=1 Tax=Pyricularia grisea TaxID=148305 RepID=A0A6P8ASD1_PYRGI|nr:uncharacterized protein PgNI_09096 [Pyricularia grisea]TLD05036.1 hypothetical protein PgNI_09096 [Pyricularia grisea]
MISARRHASTVVTQWPRSQPWILKTRLPSRHFSQAVADEQSEADGKVSTYNRYAAETPLAKELDSLGVYRRGVVWQTAMRKRLEAEEAAESLKQQPATKAGKGGKIKKEGRTKRATSGLARLRKLVAAKSPEKRTEIWETIIDAERLHQQKIASLRRKPGSKSKLLDDRSPQAAKIVHEALIKYDQGKLTEAERLKLEANLARITLSEETASEDGPKNGASKVSKASKASKVSKASKASKQTPGDSDLKRETRSGDRSRIHVVNEKLCDDVLKCIPSLERHKGCDIIDLYPGTGLFSQKLNDLLQPRSHILLEPEPEIYQKFLEPILQRPGSRLVPKSGIVWDELNNILKPEFLPHQKIQERTSGQAPTRNDTLLLVANLGFFPSKTYLNFKSVVSLVMYQLISAIKLRNLVQKYGLVRMLVWVKPPEADTILPKDLTKRRRAAVEAELLTEYIAEICTGPERMEYRAGLNRHGTIEVHSCRRTLDRMRESGLKIPDGRQISKPMRHVLEAEAAGQDLPQLGGTQIKKKGKQNQWIESQDSEFDKGISRWLFLRVSYAQELLQMRKEAEALWVEMHEKRNLLKSENPDPELLHEIESIQEKLDSLSTEWNNKFERYSYGRGGMHRYLDELLTFRMDPPVLTWDRRPVEPFLVRPEEFYPNIPLSLLDIQPKAANPMLLENGVGSTRHGDHFDRILQQLFSQRARPVVRIMAELAHGAEEGLDLENLESFKDPRLGGAILKGHDVVRPATLNERQLMDVLVAWMNWPFRPSYAELAARNRDEDYGDDA